MTFELPALDTGPLLYFLLHSGVFVTVMGLVFFILGLVFGALTWGRYKRKMLAHAQTLEEQRQELALLKRRLAGHVIEERPAPPRPAEIDDAVPAIPSAEEVPELPGFQDTWDAMLRGIASPPPQSRPPESAPAPGFKPRTLPPAPLISNNNAPASGAPRQPRKTGVISAMTRSQSWDSPAFEPLTFLMSDAPAPPPQRPAARRASLASIIHGGDAGAENDSALAPDDLTRIRGITPGIQQKLRSLGVRRYEHIASWTPQQVRDISRHLAFKDRIEREDWTGQARDLAAAR